MCAKGSGTNNKKYLLSDVIDSVYVSYVLNLAEVIMVGKMVLLPS